jgi:hypothetical protein
MSLPRPEYEIPANIHFSCTDIFLQTIARKKPAPNHLLNVRVSYFTHYTTHQSLSLQSDATPRPARPRKPPIPIILMVQRPPTINLPQPIFVRLGRLLRFPGTNSIHPIRNDQPRDPLDVCIFLLFLLH